MLRKAVGCGALLAFVLVASGCTGGSTGTTAVAGSPDGGGLVEDGSPGAACTPATGIPTEHRAAGPTCTATPNTDPDAGFADNCLADKDCPTGNACACSNEIGGGNVLHTNTCLPSNCRVDSDCGAGGYCSPSVGGLCSALAGFFCHTAADCCRNDADCAGTSPSRCEYEPTLGRWQCAAVGICAG